MLSITMMIVIIAVTIIIVTENRNLFPEYSRNKVNMGRQVGLLTNSLVTRRLQKTIVDGPLPQLQQVTMDKA